ncbi:MAG: Flp family type IVb pilin [Peptococcaceae bacterium]|nr:Flp family type IVb pilin [Peptococcaceae bacterium]
MQLSLAELWVEETGQGMAEYVLILSLVALIVAVALPALGNNISAKLQVIADELSGTG